MKAKCIVAVLLACGATAARAQGPRVRPIPAVGERIRVAVPAGEPIVGSLAALGGDTLLLARPGDTAVMVRVSEQRVDVLRRRRETWSGVGALAGVAAGLTATRSVFGAAAAGVTGGLIGFFVAPRRWQRLTVIPRRDLPPPAGSMHADAAAPLVPAVPAPPAPPPGR